MRLAPIGLLLAFVLTPAASHAQSAEEYLERAEAWRREGKLDGPIAAHRDAVELCSIGCGPTDSTGQYLDPAGCRPASTLARLLVEKGELEEAIAEYRTCLELLSTVWHLDRLVTALREVGKEDEVQHALDDFRRLGHEPH